MATAHVLGLSKAENAEIAGLLVDFDLCGLGTENGGKGHSGKRRGADDRT